MSVRFDPASVTERLRCVGQASDLTPSRRLDTKVDLSAAAVTRRLRLQSELRDACLKWVRIGQENGLNQG